MYWQQEKGEAKASSAAWESRVASAISISLKATGIIAAGKVARVVPTLRVAWVIAALIKPSRWAEPGLFAQKCSLESPCLNGKDQSDNGSEDQEKVQGVVDKPGQAVQ